jgi:two-component system phosphate regulon sensor histidine kinase PhoR
LGDEMHLTNVVYNIIDNAIKYSKSKLHLQIGSRNAKGGVVLSFTDDGIGMSPSQQKKAFEKFYRVSTGDLHDVKGFGLGLSYVKRIVETHGGYIALSSTIDKGSTFEIYLPFEPINIQI